VSALARFTRLFFGAQPVAHFKDRVGRADVKMGQGAPQGMGLAGVWHGLVHARVVAILAARHPGVQLMFLADDTYLTGPSAAVFAALDDFETVLAEHGMRLQKAKTALYSNEPYSAATIVAAAVAGITIPTTPAQNGFLAAGIPVGTLEYKTAEANRVANDLIRTTQLIDALYTLSDPADNLGRPSLQQIVRLIRLTIQAGFHHMIRGLDPQITRAPAARVDTAVENVVLGLLGMRRGLSEDALARHRARLRLPIALGGFGFRSLARGAEAAHLAAWMMCARLVVQRVPGLAPAAAPAGGLAPGVQPLAAECVADFERCRPVLLHILAGGAAPWGGARQAGVQAGADDQGGTGSGGPAGGGGVAGDQGGQGHAPGRRAVRSWGMAGFKR